MNASLIVPGPAFVTSMSEAAMNCGMLEVKPYRCTGMCQSTCFELGPQLVVAAADHHEGGRRAGPR